MSDVSTTPEPVVAATGIRISKVRIRNFRCIDEIELDLEPGTTYLVGENNSGKTSILYALWSALGSRRPLDDDLHRSEDGSPAEEASVDIWIVPTDGNVQFAPELSQQLLHVQRDQIRDIDTLAIRIVFKSSREGHILSTRRSFLQPNDENTWVPAEAPALPPSLMNHLEAHLLHASRDLDEERGNLTSVWGRVLADLQIDQISDQGESRHELEEALSDIAKRIREASPVLRSLGTDLAGITEAQASVGRVELQPVPPRLEELARTAEVELHQEGQPVLPLRLQGLGSRSLATMLVFKTLAQFRLGADSEFRTHIITLLEEPEAHLHPQAISALQSLLDSLPGQRIVSTHSSQLVSHIDPRSVRIIRRLQNSVKVLGLPPETAKKIAQFRRFVERPFGEIIFAKAIVLCDGSTERCVLPVLLYSYFERHPAGLGVSFVDCESMNRDQQTNAVVKAAHELDIKWVVFADNDDKGISALERIINPATDKPLSPVSSEVIMSGRQQIEQLLIDAGYTDDIETVALEKGETITSNQDSWLNFLKRNKPWASEQVAIKAVNANRPLPGSIRKLGEKIEELLGIEKSETSGGDQ